MVFVILGVVLLMLFAGIQIWRSGKKEREKHYNQKLREQALTESLKNSYGKKNGFQKEYQAQSMAQVMEQEHLVERNRQIVRLTISGKQNRDYVLSPEKPILIGSASGKNDIVLEGSCIGAQQCQIFLYNHCVFAKNLNPAYPVLLRRKNNQMNLASQAVRMMTGDRMTLGNHILSVSIMDYIGNTVQG